MNKELLIKQILNCKIMTEHNKILAAKAYTENLITKNEVIDFINWDYICQKNKEV